MTKKIKVRRSSTNEFKTQIVQLHLNGKRKCKIIREYGLSYSVLNTWIDQFENTGFLKKKITSILWKRSFALLERKTGTLRWRMIF